MRAVALKAVIRVGWDQVDQNAFIGDMAGSTDFGTCTSAKVRIVALLTGCTAHCRVLDPDKFRMALIAEIRGSDFCALMRMVATLAGDVVQLIRMDEGINPAAGFVTNVAVMAEFTNLERIG